MKNHNFIKLLLVVIVGATCFLGTRAHITIVKQTHPLPDHQQMTQFKPIIDLNHYNLKSERNDIKTYTSIPQLQQKRTSEAITQTFTVTCNIVGDENKFGEKYGNRVSFLNNEVDVDYFASEWGSHQVVCTEVPIGTYDIIMGQWTIEGTLYYIIKEQVNITSDTTIFLDLNDATNLVEANMLKPDGTMCNVPIIDVNTNEIIDEGNIPGGMVLDFYIVSTETNNVASGLFIQRGFDEIGKEPNNRFYVNNISDRFKILLSCTASESTMDYMMSQSKDGINGNFTFANNPADYVLYQELFQPTPAYNPEEGGGTISFQLCSSFNGIVPGGILANTNRISQNGLTSFYLDASHLDDDNVKMLFNPGFSDMHYQVIEDWGDTTYYRSAIYGQTAVVSKSGVEYVNSAHSIFCNPKFKFPEDPNTNINDYPGNPHFSFTDQQKVLAYGTGCPINVVMAQNSYQEWIDGKISFLDFAYLGRYGEVRGTDLVSGISLRITYNQDSIICSDISAISENLFNFAMEHKEGQLDVDIVNTNVEVDGLPGKNKTHVFYDWTQKDWTAPTLQMLWLRDSDGNITDRFASANEGILEFASGDFNFQQNTTTMYSWFDCQPQSVEVSYSPYDAENWEPFAVEEVSENFFMPGYGYFYRGYLNQVEGSGEKGWFDLKIKLTDLSGNYQEQVISPAFRIDDLAPSAINDTKIHTECTELARYSIDGKLVNANYCGVTIVRYSDSTTRKILVK